METRTETCFCIENFYHEERKNSGRIFGLTNICFCDKKNSVTKKFFCYSNLFLRPKLLMLKTPFFFRKSVREKFEFTLSRILKIHTLWSFAGCAGPIWLKKKSYPVIFRTISVMLKTNPVILRTNPIIFRPIFVRLEKFSQFQPCLAKFIQVCKVKPSLAKFRQV